MNGCQPSDKPLTIFRQQPEHRARLSNGVNPMHMLSVCVCLKGIELTLSPVCPSNSCIAQTSAMLGLVTKDRERLGLTRYNAGVGGATG